MRRMSLREGGLPLGALRPRSADSKVSLNPSHAHVGIDIQAPLGGPQGGE